MPQPTQAQFDSAAKKVMETAPAGLSRDAFFSLIDTELAKSPLQRANETPLKEPITYDGGFNKSLKGTALKTGKGVVEGLNPMNTLRGFRDALKNYDPDKANADFISGKRTPPITMDSLRGLSDPETGGKAIGGLTQALLLSAGSRLPLRSIVSGTLDTVGKTLDSDTAGLVEPRLPPAGRKMQGLAKIIGKTPGTDMGLVPLAQDIGVYGRGVSRVPRSLGFESIPPTPENPITPLAQDLGPGAVLHGADQFGSSRAYGYSPGEPKPSMGPIGNITGKAPALEDVLTRVIDEIRAEGEPASTSTLPMSENPVGEGALKQSGKFSRGESVGQAGGFTSGRPPVTGTRMDEILQKLGGRGEGVTPGVDSPPPVEAGPPPAAETTPGKPRISFKEALTNLQRQKGARDASGMIWGKQGPTSPFASAAERAKALRDITGIKGQVPLEAEQRIEDALIKAMTEGEE